MSNIGFRARGAILVLGWLLVIASTTGSEFSSDTPWPLAFHLLLTVSLLVLRRADGRVPEQEQARPAPPTWAKTLVESKSGMVVLLMLSLIMMVGQGSLVGVLICVPVQGIAETVASFPEVLAAAVAAAAMSMLGFLLLTLLLSMLGRVLSAVFEAWIGYIAPVIGGTVGAGLASGWVTGAILIVVTSALIGGLALVVFRVSTSEESVGRTAVGEILTAGLGFGLVNGLFLAGLWKIWEILR